MASWEKLLQHVLQELYARSGSGSNSSVGDGSTQDVRGVRVARARALPVCASARAGISVTLSELCARRAGGAGRPGRSGAVRRAAPPGLGRPRPSARLYGQELAAAAHPGAGAWWVGAGSALAPLQPERGSGGRDHAHPSRQLPPKPHSLHDLGL